MDTVSSIRECIWEYNEDALVAAGTSALTFLLIVMRWTMKRL
jgi:hypothetical protein